MASETILHDYWRSSAAYRLRIALGLLGIAYETKPVDLVAGQHRATDYLALNPQGLVPTLEIDGLTLTQSLSILEYLDETRNAGFLPSPPAERARVRALAHAIAVDLHPVCNLSVAKYAAEHSAGEIDMKSWMHAFIPDRLAAFEVMLGKGAHSPFCCGETISLADICLVPQIYNARRWEVDLTAMPRINAVMTALENLPAVAAAHPDNHNPAKA